MMITIKCLKHLSTVRHKKKVIVDEMTLWILLSTTHTKEREADHDYYDIRCEYWVDGIKFDSN